MKQLSVLFIAGALLSGSVAKAQTVDEIVKKHNDAIGGLDSWKKVSSLKMTGAMNAQGMEIKVVSSTLDGKGNRQDINISGMANYMITTPTQGWAFFPIQGQTKPEPFTADQIKERVDDLTLLDPVSAAAAMESKLEFIGKDDVEGTECLKLKVTSKNGVTKTEFIDPSNYHIIRETRTVKADGKEQEIINNFSNYTKLPEGIVVPMTMESNSFGAVKFTSAEVNTIKDESIFKPDEAKKG